MHLDLARQHILHVSSAHLPHKRQRGPGHASASCTTEASTLLYAVCTLHYYCSYLFYYDSASRSRMLGSFASWAHCDLARRCTSIHASSAHFILKRWRRHVLASSVSTSSTDTTLAHLDESGCTSDSRIVDTPQP